MVTRVRDKGQITIPASIRESLHITKDTVLSVAQVTPKKMVYDAVSSKFRKVADKEGITLKDLLKDLKKLRGK